MTDAQYEAWLADLSARRILLAELEYAGGTEYVATAPYISQPSDSDPNRPYDDILTTAVDIGTRIDGLISFGEVSLLDGGDVTDWVERAWRGHPIKLYLGGPGWSRDDFRLLARGRNGGVSEARRGSLTFTMEDESSVLDEVIDTGELPDDAGPVPLALGSIYNAPAYLLQPSPYEFKASYLPVTALTPKDNGNPVSHTDNLASGSFTLSAGIVGTLTVDIEEPHDTPQQVCEWVAGHYGITVGEITLPAYTVGLYYDSEVSGREILDELCAGLGAYWYLDELGELVVRQHGAPGSPDLTLVSDEIVYDQVRLVETQPPWRGLTLRWGRNHNPLSTIAGTIEDNQPAEAARLRREWRESRASQSVPNYPLADREERDSVIQTSTDAATERNRLLALRSTRREVWSLEAFLPPVRVGMSIAVDHPRLAGSVGRIISVSRSPTRGATTVEVWV